MLLGNMEKFTNLTPLDESKTSKPLDMEYEANEFLKTQAGLKYLCLKFRHLTVIEAIKEFKKLYHLN